MREEKREEERVGYCCVIAYSQTSSLKCPPFVFVCVCVCWGGGGKGLFSHQDTTPIESTTSSLCLDSLVFILRWTNSQNCISQDAREGDCLHSLLKSDISD